MENELKLTSRTLSLVAWKENAYAIFLCLFFDLIKILYILFISFIKIYHENFIHFCFIYYLFNVDVIIENRFNITEKYFLCLFSIFYCTLIILLSIEYCIFDHLF